MKNQISVLLFFMIAVSACAPQKFDSGNISSTSPSASVVTPLESTGAYVWVLHGFRTPNNPSEAWCISMNEVNNGSYTAGVYYYNPLFVSRENSVNGEPCDPLHGPGEILTTPVATRVILDIHLANPAQPPPGALSNQCYTGTISAFSCAPKP